MKTIVFDVMCGGRFVMQHKHKWCLLFKLNIEDVVKEIVAKRPTLRNKHLELFQTENIL